MGAPPHNRMALVRLWPRGFAPRRGRRGSSADHSSHASQPKEWPTVTAFTPKASGASALDAAAFPGNRAAPDTPQELDGKKLQAARERARLLGVSSSDPETAAAQRGARNAAGTATNNTGRPSLGRAYQQAWTAVTQGVREIAGGSDDDGAGLVEESSAVGAAAEGDDGSDNDGDAAPVKAGSDLRRPPGTLAARGSLMPKSPPKAPDHHRQKKRRQESSVELDPDGQRSSSAGSWAAAPDADNTPWASAAHALDPLTGLPRVQGLTALKPLGQAVQLTPPGRLQKAAGQGGRSVALWALVLMTAAAFLGAALTVFAPQAAPPALTAEPQKAQKASPAPEQKKPPR
jgi:hypothetical protein